MGQKAINPDEMNKQVYFNPTSQQYYTMNRDPIVWKSKETGQPIDTSSNFAVTPLTNLLYAMGLHGGNATKSYINAPILNQNTQPNYSSITELFPALNSGLTQNLQQSLLTPTDTQSSGVGRFLAPSNTSQGK
jgi:hypothetical protein